MLYMEGECFTRFKQKNRSDQRIEKTVQSDYMLAKVKMSAFNRYISLS